jgi:cellulose synthase/poly-beta-1,6-N-acetylglucosamine synthase-like glycosyltransferase
VLFWASVAALAWTQAGYPAAIAWLARLRPRRVRKEDIAPSVTVLVPAHNEQSVIARRVENLLELDYPAGRFAVLVVSDMSTDSTDEIVEEISARESRVRLLRVPRGGKLAALNSAVGQTSGEVLAFTDANTRWNRDALRKLVRVFADKEVAYVCGQLRLESSGGSNRENVYWRYELWLRANESAVGSITGGNGAIYALRRPDYLKQRFGHDVGFPHQIVKRGRRAVYEPDAVAFERQSRNLEDEYHRKVRMLSSSWQHLFEGRMLQGVDRLYLFQLVSHRLLRYCSGILHVVILTSNIALARRGRFYRSTLGAQFGWLAAAGAGRLQVPLPGAGLAYYYLLVNCATIEALIRYLRSGPPAVWEKAEGTR